MVDSVFAVAFVSVILVSGCPVSIDGGGGFAMGDGVQVNSFEFKPARLVGGQATLLQLELQNMGGLNVGDVHVNLYGLSNEWYDGGGSKMIGDIVSSNLQAFDTGGLRAPDPELKTAGQKRTAVWKFKSPVEPLEGTEFVHKAYARVCYPYRTVASATVEVMGEDEWLLQEQRGGVSQHPISVKQTAAPIQISIESMQPVISDGGLRMEMKISNVGGGSAFSGGDDCSGMFDDAGATKDEIIDLNRVDFGIEGFGDCEVYGAEEGEAAISLSRGKERTVVVKCEGFSSSMPRKEMAIDIAFDYYYYIDAETSVVVVGTGEEEEEEEVEVPEFPIQLHYEGETSGCLIEVQSELEGQWVKEQVEHKIEVDDCTAEGTVNIKVSGDGKSADFHIELPSKDMECSLTTNPFSLREGKNHIATLYCGKAVCRLYSDIKTNTNEPNCIIRHIFTNEC